MKNHYIYKIIIAAISLTACSKFTEIDPPQTELVTKTVFANDGSVTAALRGIYSNMMSTTSYTYGRMEEYAGIASDELVNYVTTANQLQFYQNNISPLNTSLQQMFWQPNYRYINNANALLEGLQAATGLTEDVTKQIKGEALFIRAFSHFYLTALFGDVPYVTGTNYQVNAQLARTPSYEVLSKIETDLLEARSLLREDYSFSGDQRIEPNKAAATALLARVYLYMDKWQQAITMASEVIDNDNYSLLTDLNKVFLANSKEAIWQLQPVTGNNTPQAAVFVMIGSPNNSSNRVSMTNQMVAAFETGDQRKTDWTKIFSNASGSWPHFFKYKVRTATALTEYSMVLRLAEQYLIRAEAYTQLNDFDHAKSDINTIRTRAALSNTTATDKATLLTAINQERRVELFGEYGHRWLDLKRTKMADAVLSPLKVGWQATDTLFPIPQSEILLNPNLVQNAGY